MEREEYDQHKLKEEIEKKRTEPSQGYNLERYHYQCKLCKKAKKRKKKEKPQLRENLEAKTGG